MIFTLVLGKTFSGMPLCCIHLIQNSNKYFVALIYTDFSNKQVHKTPQFGSRYITLHKCLLCRGFSLCNKEIVMLYYKEILHYSNEFELLRSSRIFSWQAAGPFSIILTLFMRKPKTVNYLTGPCIALYWYMFSPFILYKFTFLENIMGIAASELISLLFFLLLVEIYKKKMISAAMSICAKSTNASMLLKDFTITYFKIWSSQSSIYCGVFIRHDRTRRSIQPIFKFI